MSALSQPATVTHMTLDEFYAWPGDGTRDKFQLIDGVPVAMAPTRPTHGELQANLSRLLLNHLVARDSPSRVVAEAGIDPRVSAADNVRIPDLAVSCTPDAPDQRTLPDPVVLIEILSPNNGRETRESVRAYTTIPSVREILIVHTTRIAAELYRRQPDGDWPPGPELLGAEDRVALPSLDFACPLIEI